MLKSHLGVNWMAIDCYISYSDSNTVRRSWNDKLGNCDFPLALIFLLNPQSSRYLHSRHLPNSDEIVTSVRQFSSWIIWGKTGNSSTLFAHSTELALILLRHGQYDAVEVSIPDFGYLTLFSFEINTILFFQTVT